MISLLLMRRLAGPHAVAQARATAAEWRMLLTVGYGLAMLGALVVRLLPGDGPFGTTEAGNTSAIVLRVVVLVIGVACCVGLWRGSRLGWAGALGLAVAQVLWSLALVVLALTTSSSAGIVADAPLALADGVVMAALAVALVRGRWVFGVARPPGVPVG
jgi:hypothetical protein